MSGPQSRLGHEPARRYELASLTPSPLNTPREDVNDKGTTEEPDDAAKRIDLLGYELSRPTHPHYQQP